MTRPVRMIEDESLDAELRQALQAEAARDVPYDAAAGLQQLQQALAGGEAAAVGSSWKLKLLLGGGGTGAAVAALVGWSLLRSEPAPPPATEPKPAPVVAASVAPAPPPAPKLEPPEPAPIAAPAVSSAPAPRAPAIDRRARLAEEVRHLAEVRRLAASNPAGAARMADEGHRRFAGGMLYQEREAVAISALARAGRSAEARSRGTRFVERFPQSPFAEQVRAATGLGQ